MAETTKKLTVQLLLATISFLEEMADRLDQWAVDSQTGGWSTYQVEPNIKSANDCRREAAKLRNAIREIDQ